MCGTIIGASFTLIVILVFLGYIRADGVHRFFETDPHEIAVRCTHCDFYSSSYVVADLEETVCPICGTLSLKRGDRSCS